jgi:hypothetical protein
MNIEEIVRTSMDQLARELQPPLPDPASVRARVNQSRRVRSIAVVGLAAAAAAAVVVGLSDLQHSSNGSGPTHPVEIGVDANAVWMVDGVLHIGDQAYPQDQQIDTALVPMANGAVYGARGGDVVYQPADGPAQIVKLTPLVGHQPPDPPTPVGPAADPDSDFVAILRWSGDDGRYDLFVGNAARGEQIDLGAPVGDEWPLPGDENPFGGNPVAPIYWFGVVDGGNYTTLIRNERTLSRYDMKPNGAGTLAPVGRAPLDATLDVVADVDADGRLTFTTLDGEPLSSVDDVEADGGLSHDGLYFAGFSTSSEHGGAIAIVDTHTGETRYIEPPSGTTPSFLSWSRGHTLMFRAPELASPSSGLVVACDADTLACENVAQVDDITSVVLPRL